MAHRHSRSSYSAAEAYSPTLASSTAPILTDNQRASQFTQGGRARQSFGPVKNDEDDDDDSSEDWNVYDDYNNKRPVSTALLNQSPSYHSLHDKRLNSTDLGEASPDASRALKQQNRQTLIPSGAFGFDARNGDPGVNNPDERAMDSYLDRTDRFKDNVNDGAEIELVTVPALGNEYTRQEVKAMKKPYKRKKKARDAGTKARRWVKTEDRYCGCFTSITAVIATFMSLVCLGILLYFVIPRVPIFAIQTVTPLVAVPDGASMVTHHSPTNFSMDMKINLRADNSGGWIPTRISKMEMKVYDLLTSKLVGSGFLNEQTFPGRKRTQFQFPVSFAYASLNVTGDQTWLHWINACGPQYANTARQALSLNLVISMNIPGLIGTQGTSTSLSDLTCPFTLQANQT